jgi:copper homeostasis protein
MIIREACVENYLEGKNAEIAGAERIELCENLSVGGTTPSYGTIRKCLEDLKIPTFVMIRPRGGDFCYSPAEIEIMIEDIKLCNQLGIFGIVLGVLTKNNKIDYPLLKRLVDEAEGMEVTFHKAIDELEDPSNEVINLAKVGVNRILTSGGYKSALEGKVTLNKMIELAPDEITIIVAGGVTNLNFDDIKTQIPSTEFHGKLIVGNIK